MAATLISYLIFLPVVGNSIGTSNWTLLTELFCELFELVEDTEIEPTDSPSFSKVCDSFTVTAISNPILCNKIPVSWQNVSPSAGF